MEMRFDRRIYFTLVSAVTAAGFIVICTLGQTVHSHKVETRLAAAADEEKEPLYTVREYEGRIGVFCRGNAQPFRYAQADPGLLPDYDREQLREGIGFDNEEELRAYLEDMES